MSAVIIVKVQRPVGGTGDPAAPEILVYGKGRSRTSHLYRRDLPSWLLALLERDPKLYAHATYKDGRWTFLSRAPWQSW